MPATQIEPDDGNETLDGIIDRGHGEEGFGVCHEAGHQPICVSLRACAGASGPWDTDFVILSSIDRGSRMKVGKATRLKSAPGRSWAIMCESTNQLILDSLIQSRRTNNKHTTPLVRLNCSLIVAAGDVTAVGLVEGRTSIA